MPGIGGDIQVEGDTATLQVRGMPALSKGAVYQVWVVDAGGPRPSAAFVPHADGTATAAVPEVPGAVSEVMVTREPRPGRAAPTPPTLLSAQLD
jgi:hypothetical protein